MTRANDDDIPRLLAQLKRIYKAAGIRYADAAKHLDVSEMTIKRAMAGKGLTLATLQQLCAVADVTLIELADLARQDAGGRAVMTGEQSRAVAGDIILGMTLFLLNRGWPVERIQSEFGLDEVAMTRCLVRLDRIGVIALFPGNRVRLLRQMSRDIRQDMATFELVARRVHQFFDNPDLHDPGTAWTSGIARLSPSSFAQVSQQLDQIRDAVFELGERDLGLPADDVRWYMMFAATRAVPIEQLLDENEAVRTAERARREAGAADLRPRRGAG